MEIRIEELDTVVAPLSQNGWGMVLSASLMGIGIVLLC